MDKKFKIGDVVQHLSFNGADLLVLQVNPNTCLLRYFNLTVGLFQTVTLYKFELNKGDNDE